MTPGPTTSDVPWGLLFCCVFLVRFFHDARQIFDKNLVRHTAEDRVVSNTVNNAGDVSPNANAARTAGPAPGFASSGAGAVVPAPATPVDSDTLSSGLTKDSIRDRARTPSTAVAVRDRTAAPPLQVVSPTTNTPRNEHSDDYNRPAEFDRYQRWLKPTAFCENSACCIGPVGTRNINGERPTSLQSPCLDVFQCAADVKAKGSLAGGTSRKRQYAFVLSFFGNVPPHTNFLSQLSSVKRARRRVAAETGADVDVVLLVHPGRARQSKYAPGMLETLQKIKGLRVRQVPWTVPPRSRFDRGNEGWCGEQDFIRLHTYTEKCLRYTRRRMKNYVYVVQKNGRPQFWPVSGVFRPRGEDALPADQQGMAPGSACGKKS